MQGKEIELSRNKITMKFCIISRCFYTFQLKYLRLREKKTKFQKTRETGIKNSTAMKILIRFAREKFETVSKKNK